VPDIIVEWSSNKALKYRTEIELHEDTVILLAARLCAVKYRGLRDPIGLIHSLLSIKHDLSKWAENLPEAYVYTTVATKATWEVLSNYYHIYQDDLSAEVWNNYRCTIILTDQLILDCLRSLNTSLNSSAIQFPASL
jgi:hypothetical protein